MRRHLLGIIALALVLAGFVGLFFGYSAKSQAGMAAGVGLRAGLVLAALWMAFPQLQQIGSRFPPWLIGLVAVGGLLVVIRPRTIVYVAPALAAFAALQFAGRLFRPLPNRSKRRPSTDGRRRRPPPPSNP